MTARGRQFMPMRRMQRPVHCALLLFMWQLVCCGAFRAPEVLLRASTAVPQMLLQSPTVLVAATHLRLQRPALFAHDFKVAHVRRGCPQDIIRPPRRLAASVLMSVSEGAAAAAGYGGGDGEPSTPKVVSSTPKPPRVFLRWLRRQRLPLKWVVLILLVVQNAATTILVQTTRSNQAQSGVVYLGGAAVLISELIKLPTCLLLICREEGGVQQMITKVHDAVFSSRRIGDTMRMGVPALCYGLQNLLFFVALSNLSATSYQLWSQTKVLFTALFFVKILGQRLRLKQLLALTLLTGGVAAVQLAQAGTETAQVAGLAARGASVTGSTGAAAEAAAAGASLAGSSVTIGIVAVLLSSLLSGFANVYFEKVLKEAECEFEDSCELSEDGRRPQANAPVSLWVRNVQLAIFSIPQAALLLLFSSQSRSVIAEHGLLAGFTPLVWLVTLLTACGGLLIAAVVKYADNVLKTYATAIAIVVTCIIGTVTTGVAPAPGFLCGMALVLLSMLMYNDVDRVLLRKSRVWLKRSLSAR